MEFDMRALPQGLGPARRKEFAAIVIREASAMLAPDGFRKARKEAMALRRTSDEDVSHVVQFVLGTRGGAGTFSVQLRVDLDFVEGRCMDVSLADLIGHGHSHQQVNGTWNVPDDPGQAAGLVSALAGRVADVGLRWFEPRTTLDQLIELFRRGATDGVERHTWPIDAPTIAINQWAEKFAALLAPQVGQLPDGRRRPPIYWFWLGSCHAHRGEEAEARSAFSRYLAICDHDTSIARVERVLEAYFDRGLDSTTP